MLLPLFPFPLVRTFHFQTFAAGEKAGAHSPAAISILLFTFPDAIDEDGKRTAISHLDLPNFADHPKRLARNQIVRHYNFFSDATKFRW